MWAFLGVPERPVTRAKGNDWISVGDRIKA